MKRIKMIIHEPSVNKIIGRELELSLPDNANIIDAIGEADRLLKCKGGFPIPDYGSLAHMVYNPIENRFYKQVAVLTYDEKNQMFHVRSEPKTALPDRTTVVLIPAGGCISEWEEAIDFERFSRAMQGG
ncbi:MAG TPA: hypothetical protein VJ249_09540 [Candidatus Bathyarchaeia archaeon]|nr:hypothetical protein [Candidatus Bathyarchaeia archaeon]